MNNVLSTSFVSRTYKLAAAVFMLAVSAQALADHGGSTHINIGLSVPATSTGDYTVSWDNSLGRTYELWQSVDGGFYSLQYTGTGTAKTYLSMADGSYKYRIRWWFCMFSCSYMYTQPVTVVVAAGPPPGGTGGEDPFPPPGSFTPPNASDFPDASIVNPSDPVGDIGTSSVGALQGSGGVSGGQASYSIPIVVPPGRKGMQPNVSLNYSSSGGNGIAGVGWGLSATSAISRCSATAAQDGFTAGVQYDAIRDRLCLDGKRLMLVSGTYGASNAVYRTELDIFARIKQYGSINSSTTYFIVQYKNNNKAWFGNTTDSRHAASGRSEVMTWAINRSQDYSKNTITYVYDNFGNGERPIKAIHYTGYNGSNGDRHVRFEYEDRPDVRTFYSAGGKIRRTKRLKKIKTEYVSTLIREYTLDYGGLSLSTERSLLRSVKECAYENGATPHCLPVTDFEWQEQAPQYETEQLKLHNGAIWDPQFTDKRFLHDVIPQGDMNGDGIKDWPNLQVNAEGQITGTEATNLSNCFFHSNFIAPRCMNADFDADGLSDSFRNNSNQLQIKLTADEIWRNTGITWAIHPVAQTSDTPLGFADFNGDGWIDIAMKQSDQLKIFFHSGNISAPYSSSNYTAVFNYLRDLNNTNAYRNTASIAGDMDGNGTPDIVLSDLPVDDDTPGLPRPKTILLTQSGAGGVMTTSPRSITGLYEPGGVNSHFFHDLNGDGLPDLISVTGSGQLQYRLNDGTDFVGSWAGLGINVPMRSGLYMAEEGDIGPYLTPVMSKVLTMDYDGNGVQEILVADTTVLASACAEITYFTGIGNATPDTDWFCDDGLYIDYHARKLSQVGTPLNADVKDDSVRSYTAYQFDEDINGNFITSSFPSDIVASATQSAAVDATGDGLVDVFTVFGCRQHQTICEFNTETNGRSGTTQNTNYVAGAWINRNLGTATDIPGNDEFEYAGRDLMKAAEDGFGNRHEWVYKPLSSDKYDTGNSVYYDTTHDYFPNTYDYFHFASSMNVVADHRASNGIGGLNSTKYRYRGAVYNNKGRGFQGFRTIIVEDDVYASGHALASTDKISRTDFHQLWPTSSIVDQACTFLAADNSADDNPNCSSAISKTVVNTIENVATAGGARFVAIKKQTSTSNDLGTRLLLTTRVTNRTFDSAGNVTYESQSHDDDWTTNLTETTSTYALDWGSNWWLNKISTRVVKHNPVSQRHVNSPFVNTNQDQQKIVTTTFSTYNSSHRLPTSIVVTANDSPLSQTVSTIYNSYGLPSQIDSTGTAVTGPRSITTTYTKNGTTQSSDGYFPYTVQNALGHTGTIHTDPAHGQPTSQWDANNLLSTTVYDPFGRVSESTPAGQPTVYRRYWWCDGSPWCIAGASYRIDTIGSGIPRNYIYIDSLGRDIYALTRNFADTNWGRVRTTFDARGNTTYVSLPRDPSVGEPSKGVRYNSYDALNRLTSKTTDQTNGQTLATTYTHARFTSTIVAGSITMERTFNGLGQLVETKDGNNGYTRYAYDGAGNPIVLADPKMLAMGNVTGIKAAFNALGHKEWVEDPDWWDDIATTHGSKVFTYNGLGEVLTEIDPNGNIIEMTYDVLGRLTDRTVNGILEGKWHFDNPDTYKGLGLLDFEDSQFRADDGSRLQKFYYYSAASTGRKDLLQVTHRFYEDFDENDFTDYDTQFFTDSYYARPKGLRYPGGTSLAYEYNSNGHVIKEKDPTSGVIYRQITAKSTLNQVTAANVGNHTGSYRYQLSADFYSETGQAETMSVGNGSSVYQTLSYTYEQYGNLKTRHTTVGGGTTELFDYDKLQRLITSTRSYTSGNPNTVNYVFDASGSFTAKSDYASSYSYHSSRPHVLNSVSLVGGGSRVFDHDQNGNLTQGDGENITYNAFNKPVHISNSSISADFTYGADLLRYRQVTPSGSTLLYIDKLMEIETAGSAVDYRHYLNDIAIVTKTGSLNDPNPGIQYTFRDRLGGISMLGNSSGTATEYRGYDAYGKPRNANWSDKSPATINSSVTDRGFTDHEHLDEWQLIHMNGRGYDYNLGRFLSVDPIIQDPGNSQSINAYSYIMNNPLSGTDPTGYAGCAASRIPGVCDSLPADWGGNGRLGDFDGGEDDETSSGTSGTVGIFDNGADQDGTTGSNDPSADPDEIKSKPTGDEQQGGAGGGASGGTGGGSSTRRDQCALVDACDIVDYADELSKTGSEVAQAGEEFVEEAGMFLVPIPVKIPFWKRIKKWFSKVFSRGPSANVSQGGLGALGRAGKGKGVREVVGDAGDARKLFDDLRGSNAVTEVKPGVFTARSSNGATVTFRAASKSGPPTVDVHGIEEGIRKIKFVDK